MKIIQINSFSNGSTGKIMMSIHKELLMRGYDSYVVWGRGRKNENNREIYLNDKVGVYFHALYSRLTGKNGFASKSATKKLIKKLDEIKPDIIHLHNIHGYYINIELLFNYIRENNIKVIWTLHDCWAFTGQCSHFITKKCYKWLKECKDCPLLVEYPKAFVDNSSWNYQRKKELFTGLNITVVTPSNWLAELVKKSYLKEYQVRVINNGIDTNIFKPTESTFRQKYNIENKIIILGVAGVWTWKKGFYDFIKLSKVLDEKYKIVLIGLNKKQLKQIPDNIIGINRTENQEELAGIYTTADLLFNPTYEDNYPTVNIEAISCGTPVLSYDTGGSIEFTNYLNNKNNTYIIEKDKVGNNYKNLIERIEFIIKENKKEKIEINKNDVNEKTMLKKYLTIYKGEL